MAYRLTMIIRQVMPDDVVEAAKSEFPGLSEADAVKASIKLLEAGLEKDFPGAELYVETEVV